MIGGIEENLLPRVLEVVNVQKAKVEAGLLAQKVHQDEKMSKKMELDQKVTPPVTQIKIVNAMITKVRIEKKVDHVLDQDLGDLVMRQEADQKEETVDVVRIVTNMDN